MSNIKLFENPEFGKVRVVEVNNEPYFVGVDVAEILGYRNSSKAIKDHCDEDNYKVLTYKALNEMEIASLWSGNDYSNKVIINELGVYELILGSELPSAKSFRKWVTSEVLPSIRKNGAYMTEQTLLIGELAKILTQNGYNIGERRLFQWLRNNHYLGSKGERYNIPNQEYVEMGLFDIKQSIRTINDIVMTIRTTKVTPKGQQYFINKLCKLKQIIF